MFDFCVICDKRIDKDLSADAPSLGAVDDAIVSYLKNIKVQQSLRTSVCIRSDASTKFKRRLLRQRHRDETESEDGSPADRAETAETGPAANVVGHVSRRRQRPDSHCRAHSSPDNAVVRSAMEHPTTTDASNEEATAIHTPDDYKRLFNPTAYLDHFYSTEATTKVCRLISLC